MLTVALEEDLSPTPKTNKVDPPQDATTEVPCEPAATASSLLIPRLSPAAIDPSPFFFLPGYLAKVLHCTTPSEDQLRGAIRHLGYRVTRSHCKAGSIRTSAPWSVVWEIYREFVRTQKPIKEGAVKEGTAGWTLLGGLRGSERSRAREMKQELEAMLHKVEDLGAMRTVLESALFRLQQMHSTSTVSRSSAEVDERNGVVTKEGGATDINWRANSPAPVPANKLHIVFDGQLGKEKERGKLVRYQINPRANWGPMNRAGGNAD